jgi:hypothetical protein
MTTYRLYEDDLATYVDIPGFQFGDSSEWRRGQDQATTVSGHIAAVDRSWKSRTVAGLITGLTHEQMQDVREFFTDTLEMAINQFYIRIENQRDGSGWNQFKVPIYAGATVAGTAVDAGDGYTAGERIPADYMWLGPLRLQSQNLKFIERQGDGGGTFEVSIVAVRENV